MLNSVGTGVLQLHLTGLNNALGKNKDVALPAFIASLVLFLIGFFWLYLLPMGYSRKNNK